MTKPDKFENFSVTEFKEIKNVGKIMGPDGDTIKELTDKNKVMMTVGTWVVKKRRKTVKEIKGALITGRRSNIDKAKKRMNELDDSSDDENKDENKKPRY